MDSTIWLDILLSAGAFALILGFMLHRIRTTMWVKQYGMPVTAYVTHINPGKRYLANKISIITAKWMEPRTWRLYTFEGISVNPGLREGALVTVRIDPHHPQHYMMDVQ